MSTLVAIGYNDLYKAEEVRLMLRKMKKEYLLDLEDAVVAVKDDVGINDAFMKELAETMKPGSSVLFALVRSASPDRVLEELKGTGGKVLRSSLSHEDETRLQTAISAAKAA